MISQRTITRYVRSELAPFAVDVSALPEAAFVLTCSGMLAIAVWVSRADRVGILVAGVTLCVCGLTGLYHLPLSAAAVVLLIMAGGSLVMEVLAAPGWLLHAAGGAVALGGAGLCLHEPGSGAHPAVAVPAALVTGAGTWWAARISARASRDNPLLAAPRLTGREAVVLDASATGDTGHAVIAGHVWNIHDPQACLQAGQTVCVTHRTDHHLRIRHLP
jgi:membrane-bound ClpP family serine protease